MIAGYLGATDQFDGALAQYSEAYADQAERDYGTFRAAIRSGRLSTDVEKDAGLEFLLYRLWSKLSKLVCRHLREGSQVSNARPGAPIIARTGTKSR